MSMAHRALPLTGLLAAPLLGKMPVDLTPQIARRACARYERRGRLDGHADRDRLQAEHELRHDPRNP